MKIDKSFLERIEADGNGVIARAIIAIGHALDMTIVGEGVETEGQLEFPASRATACGEGGIQSPGPCHVIAASPRLSSSTSSLRT